MPPWRDAYRGMTRVEDLARIYTMVGNEDAAIQQLDFLLSHPSMISVTLLKLDPRWDPLRKNPKFEALLKVALSGRLPSKFYVHAGERISAKETRGMGYTVRSGERIKVWDNKRYRMLPVTNFSVILPISVPESPESHVVEEERALVETLSNNDQMAELADEFAVFQGETKNALTAVVSVVAVIGVLLLFINLVLIIK